MTQSGIGDGKCPQIGGKEKSAMSFDAKKKSSTSDSAELTGGKNLVILWSLEWVFI